MPQFYPGMFGYPPEYPPELEADEPQQTQGQDEPDTDNDLTVDRDELLSDEPGTVGESDDDLLEGYGDDLEEEGLPVHAKLAKIVNCM